MSKKSYSATVYCGIVNGKQVNKHIRANSQRELNKKVAEIKSFLLQNKDVFYSVYGQISGSMNKRYLKALAVAH